MYEVNESELAALERESRRVKKATGVTSHPDDVLLISWFPGSLDTPSVPCGLAKALGPQRIAEMADRLERLGKEHLLQGGRQCFLSERQAMQYSVELTAYLREVTHGKKAFIIPVK